MPAKPYTAVHNKGVTPECQRAGACRNTWRFRPIRRYKSAMALPLQAIFVGIFVQSLWGGNPIGAKLGLEAFPPMWSAFIRFVIGAVCVIAWAKARGLSLRPTAAEWPRLMMVAALFSVQIALMNIGFDLTSGAMGVILISTFPLWGALFSPWMVPGDRLTPLRVVGLLIAFGGTAVALARGDGDALNIIGAGNLIVMLSALVLGLRLTFSARVMRGLDTVKLTVWQMLLSLPVFLAGALFEEIKWEGFGWRPVLGLLYQGVVVAGFGFTINNWMLKRYDPSVILAFGFVAPVCGVLAAAWILGETLTWSVAIGAAAVGAGLVFVTWERRRKA